MTDARIEEYEQLLLEMAEHELKLAKATLQRALLAKDAQAMDECSRTLADLARSARENLTLRAELQRSRRQGARRNRPVQAAPRAEDVAEALLARRRGPFH